MKRSILITPFILLCCTTIAQSKFLRSIELEYGLGIGYSLATEQISTHLNQNGYGDDIIHKGGFGFARTVYPTSQNSFGAIYFFKLSHYISKSLAYGIAFHDYYSRSATGNTLLPNGLGEAAYGLLKIGMDAKSFSSQLKIQANNIFSFSFGPSLILYDASYNDKMVRSNEIVGGALIDITVRFENSDILGFGLNLSALLASKADLPPFNGYPNVLPSTKINLNHLSFGLILQFRGYNLKTEKLK